jgi:hypothetical protein
MTIFYYLPVLSTPACTDPPCLLYPAEGQVIDTLLPVYVADIGAQETFYCIKMQTPITPHAPERNLPEVCGYGKGRVTARFGYELLQNAINVWSVESHWAHFYPPADVPAEKLPAPNLLPPVYFTDTVRLQWEPVPNALGYSVCQYVPTGGGCDWWSGTAITTSRILNGYAVSAANRYRLGLRSEQWFTSTVSYVLR